MSTAVWMVMCSEPMIRAPARGWASANSARVAMRPGISCSASWISLRPKPAQGEVGDLEVVGGEGHVWCPPRVDGIAHAARTEAAATERRSDVVAELEPAGSPMTALPVARRPARTDASAESADTPERARSGARN